MLGVHQNPDFSEFRFWPELIKKGCPEPELRDFSGIF
jgi:hypothetical protein